jgi:hypothetical protein
MPDDCAEDDLALAIDASERDRGWTFALHGEPDVCSAPSLERALDAAPAAADIVLDLRGLDASTQRACARSSSARSAPARRAAGQGSSAANTFSAASMSLATAHVEFMEADPD